MKLLPRLSYTVLILVALSLVAGLYLYAFQDNPAVIIKNSPLPTDKTLYHPGNTIFVTMDYCKYTSVPLTRYVSFSDGLVFALAPVSVAGGAPGCRVQQVAVAVVPFTLPSGTYHLVGINEYHVNILATRETRWYSSDFVVVNSEIP